MQDTQQETMASDVVSLLDLPIAKLQIVQASDVVNESRLSRAMLEPRLETNADGLQVLTVRRQGKYREFAVPYVGTEIIMADAELGLIVVLVGYHSHITEKYGRLGYKTQKGQFYRYYRQSSLGIWESVKWAKLNDALRMLIIVTVEETGPAWARRPGKLADERKPPTKRVAMTTYKVVRLIDGRFFSLYEPGVEYSLNIRMKQPAKPGHRGGYFSYPSLEAGMDYLDGCVRCIPFHGEVATPQLALLEVEIGGRIIDYGHKLCSTYLCPVKVLEVRDLYC
jgi:hypothetical protein